MLILDEATNALDAKTEKDVMDSIYSLSKDLTVIIISHKKDTLKKCNKIFKVENRTVKIIDNKWFLNQANRYFN